MLTEVLDQVFPHKLVNVSHVVKPEHGGPTIVDTKTKRFMTAEGLKKKIQKLEEKYSIFRQGTTVEDNNRSTTYILGTYHIADLLDGYRQNVKVSIDSEYRDFFN